MRRFLLFAVALLFFHALGIAQKKGAKASVSVVPLGDTVRITDKALIYALPMTVFEIEVTLRRTIEKPGPYASFSTDLIGISDIIKAEREEWSLQSIRMKTREEIDPAEYYVIKSNTPIKFNSLILSQNGLILEINSGSLTNRGNSINKNDELYPDLSFNDLGAGQYSSV